MDAVTAEKQKQKQNRIPQEQPRGRAEPSRAKTSRAEVAAHAPRSRLHNSQPVLSILLHIIYCVGLLELGLSRGGCCFCCCSDATAPWAVNGTCVLHILRQVEVDGMAMFSLRNKSRVLNLNTEQSGKARDARTEGQWV